MPKGSWKTSSGLLDDFDFSIEEAWFGTAEKFGDAVLLHLRGIAEQEVDGEMVVVDEEHTLLYGLGDGWEVAAGGTAVTHSAGKTTFTNNSNIGRLIDSIVGLGGEVVEEMEGRGDTYQAETWIGLKFHIERRQFSFRNRETGEQVSYEVPLATDFLGTFEPEEEVAPKKGKKSSTRGSAKAGAKAGTKAGAKRGRKPAAEDEDEDEEEEAPPPKKGKRGKKQENPLREAVVAFATEYEDHASFVEDVFDPDEFDQAEELQEDEELSADVLDEDGSVWQEALAAAE